MAIKVEQLTLVEVTGDDVNEFLFWTYQNEIFPRFIHYSSDRMHVALYATGDAETILKYKEPTS